MALHLERGQVFLEPMALCRLLSNPATREGITYGEWRRARQAWDPMDAWTEAVVTRIHRETESMRSLVDPEYLVAVLSLWSFFLDHRADSEVVAKARSTACNYNLEIKFIVKGISKLWYEPLTNLREIFILNIIMLSSYSSNTSSSQLSKLSNLKMTCIVYKLRVSNLYPMRKTTALIGDSSSWQFLPKQ